MTVWGVHPKQGAGVLPRAGDTARGVRTGCFTQVVTRGGYPGKVIKGGTVISSYHSVIGNSSK